MQVSRANEPEFDIQDAQIWSADGAIAARMAPLIASIARRKGVCQQQDLLPEGFAVEQVNRCWRLAVALAAVTSMR